MILIGHRGCSYPGYNQNTIRAFNKVVQEGVPAIEFDVQLCGDGQLVVIHNLDLLGKECADPQLCRLLAEEIETCLAGRYYNDELLDTACAMNAESVNLWHHTVTPEFIDKAHSRGLAVLVLDGKTNRFPPSIRSPGPT